MWTWSRNVQVPAVPITWEGDYAPYSVIGDVKWTDVSVSVQFALDSPGEGS